MLNEQKFMARIRDRYSVFAHFILCIVLKSGMHFTLRFIFEIFMSCIALISLNWL